MSQPRSEVSFHVSAFVQAIMCITDEQSEFKRKGGSLKVQSKKWITEKQTCLDHEIVKSALCLYLHPLIPNSVLLVSPYV